VTIDSEAALAHLSASDAVMAGLIEGVGPFAMREDGTNPFRALSRAIVFQQLSGKAAGTIFGRFVALYGDPADDAFFPDPAAVLGTEDERLRAAGLSRNKAASLRDLAAHFATGDLGAVAFATLDDEAIIERLTTVRGIGRWTAEMFLMFHLRRPDVLSVSDLGIRKAAMLAYGLPELPKPEELRAIGEPWRPWRSVACWYLWQSISQVT
jgi:3-methyladenine DNA glycosylase/8-oxoguanine DNA glycosylase